jgi:hypothetical protein
MSSLCEGSVAKFSQRFKTHGMHALKNGRNVSRMAQRLASIAILHLNVQYYIDFHLIVELGRQKKSEYEAVDTGE